ncbi:MAG: peptide deformylase [Actinomycetota bacterium]
MAILRIRQFGDPALRSRATELESVTDIHHTLVADMLETMRDAPGVGLAGNQVGVLERLFVWEVEDEHGVVINPVITKRSRKTEEHEEGCLSLPGITYPVVRPLRVRLEGMDIDGEPLRIDAEGFQARVFQHETDHLDGVLFFDRLPEDLKREALRTLRDQALGIVAPPPVRAEEVL